jgi:hypothetical protein
MGYFLAVSAFRAVGEDEVVGAITALLARHSVQVRPVDRGEPDQPSLDFKVFAPAGGWTVVLWPAYFNIHDVPVCAALSEALGGVVSTVHTYDSDYWTHVLLREGRILDRFGSMPDYFVSGDGATDIAARWAGDANVVAEMAGGDPAALGAYFRHDAGEGDGKAFPDDEFALDSEWVFTDFWRRVGILYPADIGAGRRFRLSDGWRELIPVTSDPL